MTSLATDPRYPIGPAPRFESLDAAHIPGHITSLAALPENLRAAVYGLEAAQLDTPYREGGWTVRQVVHHVADSHMVAYMRTRRSLTENWPVIHGYDEKAWAKLPDVALPVEVSLELLEPLHRRWSELFRTMKTEDWARGYEHAERGRITLLQTLFLYEWHSRHHTAHIMELRKSRGW